MTDVAIASVNAGSDIDSFLEACIILGLIDEKGDLAG
jgi:hypothetical protein